MVMRWKNEEERDDERCQRVVEGRLLRSPTGRTKKICSAHFSKESVLRDTGPLSHLNLIFFFVTLSEHIRAHSVVSISKFQMNNPNNNSDWSGRN